VATFRADREYRDGRHPESVVFSNPRDDAERRDFTINAMFLDPADGAVHDFVGGRADLAARIVRSVGDPARRFSEDHLRMLRAIRFVSTLSFRMDGPTTEAIRKMADKVLLVSPERVRDELSRMLTESRRPGDAIRLLDDLGVLALILPEVAAMKGQAQPPEFHPEGDVFEHTVMMLNAMPPTPDTALALAVLLHDAGKPRVAEERDGRLRFDGHAETGADMAADAMRRLRYPNREIETVVACVRHHMQFRDVIEMKRSTLRRMIGRPTFGTELELHRLDCLASHRKMENHEYLLKAREQFAAETPLPPRWVTGRDLIAMGVEPGPGMGDMLREAYDAQIGGLFTSREELVAWVGRRVAAGKDPGRRG
jgi:poly(A) polymerase